MYKKIENLNPDQLAKALEYNGYEECGSTIRSKFVDGQTFLQLTEVQIALWRLPLIQSRRLWSFLLHVRENPENFILQEEDTQKNRKPVIATKPNLLTPKTAEEIKKSSLTKEESTSFKNKLEQAFQAPSESVTNNSFLHSKKKLPLPPKPQFSNFNIGNHAAELSEDNLPQFPQTKSVACPVKCLNLSSQLHRARNSYENQTLKKSVQKSSQISGSGTVRPLPSIPTLVRQDDQQEIYSPILDDEIEDYNTDTDYTAMPEEVVNPIIVMKKLSFNRPLPPIPIPIKEDDTVNNDDELLADYGTISDHNLSDNEEFDEIPEYLDIIEDASSSSRQCPAKPANYNGSRPLPPIPSTKPSINHELESDDAAVPKAARKISRDTKTSHNERLAVHSSSNSRSKSTSPVSPKSEDNVSPHRLTAKSYDYKNEFCYRETDRKGAKILLKGLQYGAYLIRPSREKNHLCTFSIVHPIKMLNLGVEKDDQGYLQFKTSTADFQQPKFKTIQEFVSYYTKYSLIHDGEGVILKNVLPIDKR